MFGKNPMKNKLLKRKFRAQAVKVLAFRFSILLAALIAAFSLSLIFILRFRIQVRQNRELINASNLIYDAMKIQDAESGEISFDFRYAGKAELPYYITYTIYGGESGTVFATNDPFLPLLPATKKRALRHHEENYFSDGDLNILYYAEKFENYVADFEKPSALSDSSYRTFVVETALNIDTDESLLLVFDLPKIMLIFLFPLLILSYFASLLIAKRVMKSVREMTEKAMKISGTDLESRLPLSNRGDEFDALAQSFNDLISRLQQDLKREKQFTSDVSHELGTPLAVILGQANLIRRWGKDEPVQFEKSLDSLIAEAKSMEDIINNLLAISRMENGRLKITKTQVDVSSVFYRVAENTKSWAEEADFEIHISEPYVSADESLLYEACTIIVSNSVKFAGGNARISLSSFFEDGFIKIRIADNGSGFSSETLPHVFERFFRGDEAHSRSAGGSGLGLSIVKSIMNVFEGEANASNGENGGAVVTLLFPFEREKA